MTVQIERTEMTTSDKRDTKLLSTVRAPSTQPPACGGKYKADVEWKLNIVLPGWPQPLSELDLKQGQGAFSISSKSFSSKDIPNRPILDLELGDAGQCTCGKGRTQRLKGELAVRWTKRISSNHSSCSIQGVKSEFRCSIFSPFFPSKFTAIVPQLGGSGTGCSETQPKEEPKCSAAYRAFLCKLL